MIKFPRSLHPILRRGLSVGLAVASMAGVCAPACADGVAVFASINNPAHVAAAQARLERELQISLQASSISISGVNWTRLHSAVMSEADARALVGQARSNGFSSWYNGSGDSLASSSSATAFRHTDSSPARNLATQPEYSRARDRASVNSSESYGAVTPATGDVSHLPMAEVLPLEDR